MKNLFNKATFKLYRLIFREEPSQNIKMFIEDIWYASFGIGFYAVFSFAFQVMVGRYLGPVEYGKFSLIQAVATFLSIPMNLGISTALIKYNAESDDKNRQIEIIFICCLTTLFFSFLALILFFIFSNKLAGIFHIPVSYFYLAAIFAFLSNFYLLAISIFRSMHRNREYSFFQAIYSILIFFLLLIFLASHYLSFKGAVFSIYFAYFLISATAIIRLRKYFSLKFSLSWLKKILEYGLYATMGAVSFAFLSNFNLLIINKYLSVSDAGIYNAYYFSSIAILSIILTIFLTVFFPTASKSEQKSSILNKIDKILPFIFLAGVPSLFAVEFIILKLYGGKYPMNFFLMLEFSVAAMMIFSYGFYDWLFASHGGSGIKCVALSGIIIAIINVCLSFFLIPRLGIAGAATALTVAYMTGILNYKFLKVKII